MARHALARAQYAGSKAAELAKELEQLDQSPTIQEGDAVVNLAARETRKIVLPKEALATRSTRPPRSVFVRRLSDLLQKISNPALRKLRYSGAGTAVFSVEGAAHNPTLCDLVAELYATVTDDRVRKLLFDPAFGLTEVQIGQGCGSLTMPMTDMRFRP